MDRLSFDGRVAIVTGAGRGLGRAYATLLASRGAAVVVNDAGGDVGGTGTGAGPAEAVAAEITADGGDAMANADTVASVEGAESIVAAALGRWGRLDVVVNNAGILSYTEFPETSLEELSRHFGVHVAGSFNVTRAAWPHLAAQSYGRIVMATSPGFLGTRGGFLAYATAKGGVVSLARTLAVEGAAVGIMVNVIAPTADTRMVLDPRLRAAAGLPSPADDTRPAVPRGPEEVAPVVAVLAHEACPVNGEIVAAGAGRVARIFVGVTRGLCESGLTPETIFERWNTIADAGEYSVPRSTEDYTETRETLVGPAVGRPKMTRASLRQIAAEVIVSLRGGNG